MSKNSNNKIGGNMLITPESLQTNLSRLEDIEKATLRLVVQAVYDFKNDAVEIFKHESDLVGDIGEDLTREALDRMGMSRINQRLFGKMDYKKARYLFQSDYAIKQALFVDSKAEKEDGERTATLQMSQTSMEVRQIRSGNEVAHQGELPCVIDDKYLTTTIFVKYSYFEDGMTKDLRKIIIAALPNGFLQEKYNPSCSDTIFLAGRNAPTRGEAFRVRLSFQKLQEKAQWRIQTINLAAPNGLHWSE
jgi:hypothetical protein